MTPQSSDMATAHLSHGTGWCHELSFTQGFQPTASAAKIAAHSALPAFTLTSAAKTKTPKSPACAHGRKAASLMMPTPRSRR